MSFHVDHCVALRMRALGWLLPVVAALSAVAVGPAGAQPLTGPARYAGRPVAEVRVFIERQPSADPALAELVETPAGQPLSLAAVRASIAHLFSLGRFQDIQVEALDRPDGGIELRYNLVPIHAVDRVEFRGTLGLPERLLRNTMEERFGRTPQLARAAEVARALERLYHDRGYLAAAVNPGITELHDPDRAVLTFDITAGPLAVVREVEVVGGLRTSRDDFLRRVHAVPGRPYERASINTSLAEYARRLKGRGYLQAVASHSARISEDGRAADLTIEVQPGPVVEVIFEGERLPSDRLDELVPLEREGSADEDLLEDSVQRIRAYLHSQGYWKADVMVEPRRAENRLTIVFTVRRGPAYRVVPEGLHVTGNKAVALEDIRKLVVLNAGDIYVSSHLDAIVGAIVRLYHTRGFRWVDVTSSEIDVRAESAAGAALVRPTIQIVEGPRAVLGEIAVEGATALGDAEVRRLMQLQSGAPYYEPAVTAGADAVHLEYLNQGYTSAELDIVPKLSDDRTRVDLTVAVTEGPQVLVDHVIIVGNRRTEEDVIRREVLLQPGAPLGLRDQLETRRRLSAMGLFRRVDIREVEHGSRTRRDVLITVEEAPATSVGYGGGLELTRRLRAGGPQGEAEERIELAPRGFFDIGRRNLGGQNRSVNLFTRVSVRPRDAPDDPDGDGRGLGLSEYRVIGTYRAPAALLWDADLTLTGAIEQGVRSTFNFARKGVTVEAVRRLSPALRMSARYSFGTTRTFDERLSDQEQAAIDRLFPQVRLSAFSVAIARDTRDDLVEPSSGAFVSAESSMAARTLGGQVGFVKTYLQGYWFTQVPGTRRVVLATRAAVGLADGFPREAEGTPAGSPGAPEIIEDLPASERFFAGGDTTVRGFALDTVGAPRTISPRGFPRGGNAVLILNGELRVPVWRELGAALFVDGGNVFERATDVNVSELRGSVGFGVRYRSPIGPIRLDLGFKLDRREFRGRLEPRSVLHFSIGQAF